VKSLNNVLQKPESRCFIRNAAAFWPTLSPGQSPHAYQCSEAQRLQGVLSCLHVGAMSESGILIVRGEK